jgi:molybdopterin-guanine dinucleotide biosynthesis protein MobB
MDRSNAILDRLPVLGICGFSGSGKTTLIEKLIPLLTAKGLKIAVVKHGAHKIVTDTPGKDSDRLYRAGANVYLQGHKEEFFRIHPSGESTLLNMLSDLSRDHDLVLIEGRKNIPVNKVWLLSENESNPPAEIEKILSTLPRDTDRLAAVMSFIENWLPGQWEKTPVNGCILIGGKSSRMGNPKHLIAENGKTWLEKSVDVLTSVTANVVISGDGDIPEELSEFPQLPDVPGIGGPMAGILTCMRREPHSSWLVVSCDLPDLSADALNWLISTRKPGVWATLPRLNGSENIEPLLAHYDFRSQHLLEKLVFDSVFSPAKISSSSKVINPSPPDRLSCSWKNINTKEELLSKRSKPVNISKDERHR